MKIVTSITLALGLSVSVNADMTTYEAALQTLSSAPTEVKTVMDSSPKDYTFFSQFNRAPSVSYTGQVFRQVLIEDIKTAMTAQPMGSYQGTIQDAINMLNSYLSYDEFTNLTGDGVIDGFSEFQVTALNTEGKKMDITEGFSYIDLQSPGKNLSGKLAGIDNPLRRGKLFGTSLAETPKELLEVLFQKFADNAVSGSAFTVPNGALAPQTINGAYVTKDGLDLSQYTQKFLHGAVSYSQAARDYLSTDLGPTKGLNADNTQPAEQGASYTAMELHFDEAFGYFGAARDYLSYSDADTREKKSIDTNGDGLISMLTEKTLGVAINSSRMDLLSASQSNDFSGQLMNAFLKGRNLITQKPAGYKKYVEAQAHVALGAWEKTIAALTIHYINVILAELNEYGTPAYLFSNFTKFWSEMKGFAMAFQFNPKGIMSDATFDKLHGLMGDVPVLPHAATNLVESYKTKLIQSRDLLGKTYKFQDQDVQNW